ncbi:SDR family NAD(P)-dependent oxidoreductase [Oceaniglobus roseus]|uniref:SDR family NAD(P)-dependent oxidoreductase n=1 Tax=Oceaniglobus roseus TaxID=1737570 RepID=UPI000C7EFBFE|nr:SDR family oxidoreductase [Kandeliimicrobium roseum]
MSNTALVTGASSGIGKEIARLHAEKGGDLIITARSAGALEALKAELEPAHQVKVHVFPLDLGAEGGAQELYDKVKAAGLAVDILVNNAGFGGHGLHTERALADELAMIDLNVKALVTLTHAFARDMVARGGGRILNVGSSAGFMPGPYQAVYFATKAFVASFSQAIDQELRDKGVTCTVLAPGYVETGFAKAANLEGTGLVSGGGATARSVAKEGYDAMRRGALVAFNEGRIDFAANWLIPLLPRRAVLKMVEKMQKK